MPIVEEDKLFNQNNIGREFDIYLPTDTEIKSTYILNIDSNDYGVAGISYYGDVFESSDSHYKIRGIKK
jgi:hypothetical protein